MNELFSTEKPVAPDGLFQQEADLPVVAIVGRPNVGKSTLFNRLSHQRMAIVSDIPGTTRDRIVAQASWGESSFFVMDTGGFQPAPESPLWGQIRSQVEIGLDEAQVIIFVVNVLEGITPSDLDVANLLRRAGKPVVLAVNKTDNPRREMVAPEFYELGLGDPICVSAYHNIGVDDLMAEVLKHLPMSLEVTPEPGVLRLAILGRTNVGKSSFLNALLGENRAIVSETAGTTRDSVHSTMTYEGNTTIMVDTAGIRRRGRVQPGIERYSVMRSIQALSRCDVALLIVDALDPMSAQDLHIAGTILDAYRGMAVVVNKWDLADNLGASQIDTLNFVRERLRFAPYVPVCFASAISGEGVYEALSKAHQIYQERLVTVPKEHLNREIMEAQIRHTPPSVGKRSLNIYKVDQMGTNPPAFTFSVNNPKLLHFSYQRFLENTLRKAFGFQGSRLNLIFRRRGEPA